jgi:ATP-dependent helicase/nuclease subunit B
LFEELRGALQHEFPESAVKALSLILAERRFELSDPNEARAAAALQAWRDVVRECAIARETFSDAHGIDWWAVALQMFGDLRRTEDKAPGALELQGWLELLWEEAPHLVVVGMNDGLVPDAIVGDAFLPESLRELLGLKNNAARFARDAYLLQAIAACRADDTQGRVDLIYAKTSTVGDPLRPSRLLLRCDEAELPQRVAFLFRAAESSRPNLPWTRAWKLTPPVVAPPTHVPVTGLRAWLACPFRFYLGHVLRMEPVDAAKSELDARDFGTLCHAVLEALAKQSALRDSTDEEELR